MRNWTKICSIVGAAWLAACSNAPQGQETADREIREADDDRVVSRPTEFDTSNAEADVEAIGRIRRALVNDDRLSISARNVKLIATNEVINILGEVETAAERVQVVEIARSLAGNYQIQDNLQVDTP